MLQSNNLFLGDEFKEIKAIAEKIKGKRVRLAPYLQKRKIYKNDILDGAIVDDSGNWQRLRKLYCDLATFFEFPLFSSEKESIDQDGVRVWFTQYQEGNFTHGTNTYYGEADTIIEAEVIGTELMDVAKKISVHNELLALLKAGKNRKEAIEFVCEKYRVKNDYLEN